MTEDRALDVEYVIQSYVKPFGLFQVLIAIIGGLSISPSPVISVYLLGVPKFRCRLNDQQENLMQNISFSAAARLTGPTKNSFSKYQLHENNLYGCYKYEKFSDSESQITECSDGYVYELQNYQYPGSIVEEWNLVCHDSWLVPFSTSMFMIGMMIGFIFGGQIGGIIGRRRSIISFGLLQIISGFTISFSRNYVTFAIFRCLVAVGLTGLVTNFSVLTSEFTLARTRSILGATKMIFAGCFNRLVLVLFAYNFSDWRVLNGLGMMFSLVLLIYPFILPESPRWLISMGRKSEAMQELYRAYKINRWMRKTPKSYKMGVIPVEEFFKREIEQEKLIKELHFFNRIKYNFLHFYYDSTPTTKSSNNFSNFMKGMKASFSTKSMALRSMSCIFLFGGQVLCQFGLLFYLRIIKESIYISAAINSLMVLPSTCLFACVYRFSNSRRKPIMVLYTLASIVLISGAAFTIYFQPSNDYVLNICANVSFMLLSSAMNMLYIYVPELFPSDIRTQSLGNASGFGRIAGTFCDFVNELDGSVIHGLPLLIYGIVLIILNILLCSVRDTTGEKLEDITVKKLDKGKKEAISLSEIPQSTKV